ncbi:hypothetical protein D3C87_1696850 [compost metagenome]
MRRQAQHEDVGARTEDAVFHAGDDHAFHFGVFEADALQGVVQFDVHAQVVGIQLELVARAQAAVFGDIHGQGGDGAVERQAPMAVLVGLGAEIDAGFCQRFWPNFKPGFRPICGAAHRVSPRTPCLDRKNTASHELLCRLVQAKRHVKQDMQKSAVL